MDAQHQTIFEMIGDIHASAEDMKKGMDNYEKIVSSMGKLKDYIEVHFSYVEDYMSMNGIEGLKNQKKVHRSFLERLSRIDLAEVTDERAEYLVQLTEYLVEWITQYIKRLDVKAAE